MKAEDFIEAAKGAIAGRAGDYGSSYESIETAAAISSAVWKHEPVPFEVAFTLITVKLGRVAHNPGHLDSWVDIIGYTAIAAEMASQWAEDNPQIDWDIETPEAPTEDALPPIRRVDIDDA